MRTVGPLGRAPRKSPPRPGHVVLVVDDDRDARRFVAKALREEGYVVNEGESGDGALDDGVGYSCIILGVDGRQARGCGVVHRLRARDVTTPILLLTADDTRESRVRGLDAGADDCLGKPFDLRELLALVRALIRRGEQHQQRTTLVTGALVLDRLTRRVTSAGRLVDLTPREFALLEFLMQNAGTTVSRSVIASVVWNYQFDPGTNVIDVYVNYVRKKLRHEMTPVAITTVRGVGYRLDTMDARGVLSR